MNVGASGPSAHELRLVIDTIPVMAWSLFPDGRLEFVNRQWLAYSGLSMEEALADPMGTIDPDDRPGVADQWPRSLASGTPYEAEMRLRRSDGEYRWFLVRTVPVRDESGKVVRWYGTSTDIEDRKRAEEALRKSERLLREAHKLGHTGSWEHDLVAGSITNTEENVRLFFGDDTSRGARLEDYMEAVHPDDRDYVARRRARLLEDGGARELEFRVIRPGGEVHVLCGLATVVRDETGRPIRIYGTNVDITERRQAEEALRTTAERLQALTRRLVEVQETERREISRELHDRVGQTLTAMHINMQIIHDRLARGGDPEVRARNDDSLSLIESAFRSVENLMYELRPPMLDEYGLLPSLRWYAKRFTERTAIPVEVTGDDARRSTPGVELALFRIVQEALTNVARHARATRVTVDLAGGDAGAVLTITDNGVGITRSKREDRPGYGLASMRERAESVGGALEVGAPPAGGTRIAVRVPAPREEGPEGGIGFPPSRE
jgi:two-component system sensor histidine kinase UhpB